MKDGMEDTVYRCVAPQCGRMMPRRVNFCPWCGAGQGAVQSAPPVLAKTPAPVAAAVPVPMPAPPPVQAPPPAPAPASATPVQPQHDRGIPPPPGVGRGAPMPARPPQRAPIRLRWWIAALVSLWLIWLAVRPEGTRIERRMERAVSLAVECQAREAQDELIALRGTRATPEQLRKVQQSLNKAAADCTRAEQRAKAWEDASGAIQKLRRARSYDKALARLGVFTKRWGEDTETRAMKERLNIERDRPLADPSRGE